MRQLKSPASGLDALAEGLVMDLAGVEPPSSPEDRQSVVARGIAYCCYMRGALDLGDLFMRWESAKDDPDADMLWHFCASVFALLNPDISSPWRLVTRRACVTVNKPAKLLLRLGAQNREVLDLMETAYGCLPREWDDNAVEKQRESDEDWPDFRGTVLAVLQEGRGYARYLIDDAHRRRRGQGGCWCGKCAYTRRLEWDDSEREEYEREGLATAAECRRMASFDRHFNRADG